MQERSRRSPDTPSALTVFWEGADRAARVQLLDVVSYKASPSNDLSNLRDSQCTPSRSRRDGTASTHLEDAVRLQSVDTDLGVLATAEDLPPVPGVAGARPYCVVRVLDGGKGRRLQALCDVDLLEDLPEDSEVVRQRFTVGCTKNWSAST